MSPTWRRRVARRLVRHAESILHPIRPEWSAALKSELEHVPNDHRALMWGVGCVWVSYVERYLAKSRALLAANAVGILFAFLDDAIMGRLAAQAWPHWYTQVARLHKHLGLELWSIMAFTLATAVLAGACGMLLGRVVRQSSIALPCLSVLVWQLYNLGGDVYFSSPISPFTMRSLWEGLTIAPASAVLGVALPACPLACGISSLRTG
jgi:hypothetical protein